MDFLNDHFPGSMPMMDSEGEPNETWPETMLDGFNGQYDGLPSDGMEISEAGLDLSTFFPPPAGYQSAAQPVASTPFNSQSSGSSPPSSPTSSMQANRHESSNSSRSATAEAEQIRQMDTMFDFDSAANSSKGPMQSRQAVGKTIRGMAIPHEKQSPQQTQMQLSQRCDRVGPSASQSAVSTPPTFKSERPEPHHGQTHSFEYNGTPAFTYPYLYNQSYSMTVPPLNAANTAIVSPNNFNFPLPRYIPPTATFHAPSQPEQYHLRIEPISIKTRVETQIPVKMTLNPLPLGITKLHLPARTMAKSKLIAKPRPSLSSDTLELDVMPVCASAMKKPNAWQQALALARGEDLSALLTQHKQPSPSQGPHERVNATTKIDAKDGGPISICDGCVNRERKRANRKIEKEESAEDIMWKQSEKDRIVIFNENEIMEWKPYGTIDLQESAGKRGKSKKNVESGKDAQTPAFTPGPGMPCYQMAKQVRLQMRITCYCRHQGETEGFQVIFTLKDHHGICVAQGMTTPILITDDHKTSPLQDEASVLGMPDRSRFSNGAYWPTLSDARAPSHLFNPSQSHSTNDLPSYSHHHNHQPHPALHRASTSLSLQQFGHAAAARSTGVATPSKNTSYQTSATRTPRNLSRPVSPSATDGPTAKRAKPSGFHRPLTNLTMTRIQSPSQVYHEHRPVLTPSSSSDASEGLTMATAAPTARASPPSQATPVTRPHPLDPEPTSDVSASRFEPMSAVSPSASGPISELSASRGSEIQSPQPSQDLFNPDSNSAMQALHAETLRQSLRRIPEQRSGATETLVPGPKVDGIFPNESPISGGINVCITGEGFYPGLEVLFADGLASNTIVRSSTAIVCTVPPASRPGDVPVTLRGHDQLDSPTVRFKYYDTTEQDLMSTALEMLHHRMTGLTGNSHDIARQIVGNQQSTDHQNPSNNHQYQSKHVLSGSDLEALIVSLIDRVDQTDTAFAPVYDYCGSNGQTMLHLSASLGFSRLADCLLTRGADPNSRDKNGMSPMHMASLRGHSSIIRMLLGFGGDATMRSLIGHAPIDMGMSQEVYRVMSSIEYHRRSRSLGATPVSRLSRTTSLSSIKSATAIRLSGHFNAGDIDNDALLQAYSSRPVTPAEVWARSRRNSAGAQQEAHPDGSALRPDDDTHMVTAAAALAAWRDNLAGQIQYFQQSVQRTLPNLQVPHLPPLPTFEACQEYPMVRRISSFVPGMHASQAPPSYDEIYPSPSPADIKTSSTAQALGDAIMDSKCAAMFDTSGDNHIESTSTDRSTMMRAIAEARTEEQREQLRLARARNMKNISSDRKLFLIWIPLLVLVVTAMLKDWIPLVVQGVTKVMNVV
ncbi:MAG: hypothetical protein Q9169_004995 [Polycauliona sp. 2 TL-2023]